VKFLGYSGKSKFLQCNTQPLVDGREETGVQNICRDYYYCVAFDIIIFAEYVVCMA